VWNAPLITPVVNVTEPPATIEEEPTPQAAAPEPETTKIPAEPTPLSVNDGSWALLNLMLTILTGLIMVALLILYFVKKRNEDEDEDDPDSEKKIRKYLLIRLITVITTVCSVVLFFFTQDMTLPMAFIDMYTIWHIIFASITIIFAYLGRKRKVEKEYEGYSNI
jgi:amino acid transporter